MNGSLTLHNLFIHLKTLKSVKWLRQGRKACTTVLGTHKKKTKNKPPNQKPESQNCTK